MGKIKTSVLAVGTVAVGLLSFRAFRNRRAASREAEVTAEEEEMHEEMPESAAEHAVAAVDHARIAASQVMEARREDRDEPVEA